MKHLIVSLALITLTLSAFCQSDDAAVRVLDKFSSTASTAPSVSIDFLIITNDQVDNKIDTLLGQVMLKGDSYRLNLPDNIVWYDGRNSWSLLPEEKEVTITEPEQDDESFLTRPSLIFSMYKKDYKCRLLEETKSAYIIDLYPEDIKTDLIRIRLTINKSSYKLVGLEYKRKDGITMTMVVKKYDLSVKPDKWSFAFNPSQYKDFDIIDIR